MLCRGKQPLSYVSSNKTVVLLRNVSCPAFRDEFIVRRWDSEQLKEVLQWSDKSVIDRWLKRVTVVMPDHCWKHCARYLVSQTAVWVCSFWCIL